MNGDGINKLLTLLLTVVSNKNLKNTFANQALCSERQIFLVEKAIKCINEIFDDLNSNITMDIVSMSTRELVEILDEMIGRVYTDDILNKIFKSFCVGK